MTLSKTKQRERQRERDKWRRKCAMAILELYSSVSIKFGPLRGYVKHVVTDKHGNMVAAFADEERAKEYHKKVLDE